MKAALLLPLVFTWIGSAGSEDDLAVVKKAVGAPAATTVARAERQEADRPEKEPARIAPRRAGSEPQWLRVRVVEKRGKKVSVNLPLAIVRAMGDDFPLDFPGCHNRKARVHLTVGEVLRALDTGQDLVQVEDDEHTVRVWVE